MAGSLCLALRSYLTHSRDQMKRITLFAFVICTPIGNAPVYPQAKSLPISVTCRKSFLQGSYVLQIQNTSNELLRLWLEAKGKITPFDLAAGKLEEFGWAQGYRFDANNLFLIGGEGYDTLKQRMPNVELNPVKVDFSRDGGLALSFSQSYLQQRLPEWIKLPFKTKASSDLEISLDEMPRITLVDGSERVHSDVNLHASLLSGRLRFPLVTQISFLPSYSPSTGEVTVSHVIVEDVNVNVPNSDIGLLPHDWREQITKTINIILPSFFDKRVVYKVEKKWVKNLLEAVNLRAKIIDGRLELIIL